ncbi:hypothetical protein [Streptomyces tendae]
MAVGDHLPQVDRDELRDDVVEESGLVKAGDGPLELEAGQQFLTFREYPSTWARSTRSAFSGSLSTLSMENRLTL